MPFQKGHKLAVGRPVGASNKETKRIRIALEKLLDDNADNMHEWLAAIAKESPKDAMTILMGLMEYSIPKLARQEVVGTDGAELFQGFQIKIIE